MATIFALPPLPVGIGLILAAVLLLFLAWWAHRLRKGITVRVWLIYLFLVFYVALFALVAVDELRIRWGDFSRVAVVLNVILAAVAASLAQRYTLRSTSLTRTPAAVWVYRGGLAIPGLWISLFLLRFGVEALIFHRIFLLGPEREPSVPIPLFVVTLFVLDAVFAISTGVLFGNSVGILVAHERRPRGPPEGAAAARA